MSDINLALTESKALRNSELSKYSNDKALESLNKAKALVMALWKGENLATTKQLSEYYEISEDVVWQVVKRNKDEFDSDGLTKKTGKELKALLQANPDIMSVSENAKCALLWTPRAALRLGMLLRDSEVAREVRTTLLNTAVAVPVLADRVRELGLENELLSKQLELRRLDNTMLALHGKETVLALRGHADQIIETEKPVIEVIDERHNVRYKGQTCTQLKAYLEQNYGIRLKSGADIQRILEKVEKDQKISLLGQIPRSISQSYIPEENLEKAIAILRDGARQMLIGE